MSENVENELEGLIYGTIAGAGLVVVGWIITWMFL